MTEPLPIGIRVGLRTDLHFIGDTWAKSASRIYPNNYAIDFLPKKLVDIQRTLGDSAVLIAHLEGEPEEIIAYLVYGTHANLFIARYGYTRDGARRQTIMTRLIDMANPDKKPVVFVEPTRNVNAMNALNRKYIFDPTIGRTP